MDNTYNPQQRDSSRDEFRSQFYAKGEEFATSGKGILQNELDKICTAFHSAADKLHEQNDYFSPFVDRAVNRVDSFAEYVKDHNPREMMADVNEFSKRNPIVTTGGMFAAGLALSRFIKSKEDRRE